jgi:hypothetical protein
MEWLAALRLKAGGFGIDPECFDSYVFVYGYRAIKAAFSFSSSQGCFDHQCGIGANGM